jgi:hypothetical protein
MKTVRWFLVLGIGLAVAALVRHAYATGLYVGDLRLRKDAMDNGAGYYDILGDGQWHWGPFKPTWKAPARLLTPVL